MAHHKGKLIVLDGSDGVGKATQTKLLVDRLKKEGKKVRSLDFPQYYDNFFGKFIGECLQGMYGDFVHLDPHIASVMYAADRFEAKPKIEKWLSEGCVVVLDRYVSANQMHQGGKITDPKKRKEFLLWLDRMEHDVFALPRPNLIVYLHLPVRLSLKLLQNKSASEKKKYIKKGMKDTVEGDVQYLEDSQKSALKLVASKSNWKKIECSSKNEILSREVISEKVFEAIKKII